MDKKFGKHVPLFEEFIQGNYEDNNAQGQEGEKNETEDDNNSTSHNDEV